MSLATIIMIALICVGCALGIAGLIVLGREAYRLMKAARKAGIDSMEQVQVVVRRAQGLAPRIQELQKNQKVVAERLEDLSAATNRLNYLRDELDQATGHLSHLKS